MTRTWVSLSRIGVATTPCNGGRRTLFLRRPPGHAFSHPPRGVRGGAARHARPTPLRGTSSTTGRPETLRGPFGATPLRVAAVPLPRALEPHTTARPEPSAPAPRSGSGPTPVATHATPPAAADRPAPTRTRTPPGRSHAPHPVAARHRAPPGPSPDVDRSPRTARAAPSEVSPRRTTTAFPMLTARPCSDAPCLRPEDPPRRPPLHVSAAATERPLPRRVSSARPMLTARSPGTVPTHSAATDLRSGTVPDVDRLSGRAVRRSVPSRGRPTGVAPSSGGRPPVRSRTSHASRAHRVAGGDRPPSTARGSRRVPVPGGTTA